MEPTNTILLCYSIVLALARGVLGSGAYLYVNMLHRFPRMVEQLICIMIYVFPLCPHHLCPRADLVPVLLTICQCP